MSFDIHQFILRMTSEDKCIQFLNVTFMGFAQNPWWHFIRRNKNWIFCRPKIMLECFRFSYVTILSSDKIWGTFFWLILWFSFLSLFWNSVAALKFWIWELMGKLKLENSIRMKEETEETWIESADLKNREFIFSIF